MLVYSVSDSEEDWKYEKVKIGLTLDFVSSHRKHCSVVFFWGGGAFCIIRVILVTQLTGSSLCFVFFAVQALSPGPELYFQLLIFFD